MQMKSQMLTMTTDSEVDVGLTSTNYHFVTVQFRYESEKTKTKSPKTIPELNFKRLTIKSHQKSIKERNPLANDRRTRAKC